VSLRRAWTKPLGQLDFAAVRSRRIRNPKPLLRPGVLRASDAYHFGRTTSAHELMHYDLSQDTGFAEFRPNT
jgi:hypothetical protein